MNMPDDMYHRLQDFTDSAESLKDDAGSSESVVIHKKRRNVCCRTRKRRCCCVVCILFIACVISISLWIIIAVFKPRPEIISQQTLWSSGDYGVHTYRVPIMVATPNGTLIVVVEAREASSHDTGQKHFAIRRSIDQGRTWHGATSLLSNEKDIQVDLGVLIVNHHSASIGLVYSIRYGDQQSTGRPTYSLMYSSSYDDGCTWGVARNISHQIGLVEFTVGPGYGIQKKHPPHVGRMVVCGHGNVEYDGTFCILSDDNGETWCRGGNIKSIPYGSGDSSFRDFLPNEPQISELPDGSIFSILRNEKHYHCFCRITALSFDGGESFASDSIRLVKSLPDSAVSAGLLWHNGKLLYSSPRGRLLRRTLALMISNDDGLTWPKSTVLWPLYTAYSVMTSFSNSTSDHIYLVFEKGYFRPYLSIEFMAIDLSKLK